MKKTLLLAGASLLAMTAGAAADPIFTPLTFLLFSAAPIWVSPALIYAGLQLVTAGALALGAQAAFRQRQSRANPQDIKTTRQGAEGPGRYAFGRVRLGGRIAFGNTAGYDIYRLVLHCFGPIDAIEEYYYDGLAITVDPDGAVTSPPWGTSGGSNMYVQFKGGDGTETAWTDLKTDFPTIWTDDHRVRGIGQSLLRAINPGTRSDRFQTLFQGGVKELEVDARVGRFYDPRTGQTVWTRNGVLICLHWFRLLPGMRDELIDFTDIGNVADQADELVATLTGTAPRCTLSGGWEGELTTDIVLDMLQSAGLEVIRSASDKFTFRFVEDDPASELTLLSRHIIDRELSPEEAARRPNICRVSYFSPERQFEMAEIELSGKSWAEVASDVTNYGDKEKHYELLFCDDASQAQRIARRLFWMDRAQRGVIRTTMAGVAVMGKRTITVEVPDVGTDGASVFLKCRIIAPPRFLWHEGRCEIPVAIIPDELTTPWDPATMEAEPPPALPQFQYESDLDTPTVTAATVVQYPGGGYETRCRFTHVSGGDTPEANYRTYTGGLPDLWSGMTEYTGVENGRYGWATDNTDGKKVDFRARWFTNEGEASYFSEVLTKDPNQIDNSPPAKPILDVDSSLSGDGQTWNFDVTARCNSLHAVRLHVTISPVNYGLSVNNQTYRPEINITTTASGPNGGDDITITAIAYASDGTPSEAAVYTHGLGT